MERAITEARKELLEWKELIKKLKKVKDEFLQLKSEFGKGEVMVRRRTRRMKKIVILTMVVSVVMLASPVRAKSELIQTGIAWTLTGNYKLYQVNIFQLQRLWRERGGSGFMRVLSFLDWENKKIYYLSEKSLRVELHSAQSYRNLREAALKDQVNASEAMREWLGAGRSISPRW